MKIKDILIANEPLKRLCDRRLASYKKMRELARLRKTVEQEVEFYTAEETKAVHIYAEVDTNGVPIFLEDGRLRLKDMESKIAFEKEIEKLRDTEVDGIEPVTLCESDFRSGDDLPTVSEMIALEPLVVFEE